MDYTLNDFYRDNPFPDLELVTMPLDFERIRIQSISFQEAPIDDYIKENELVLSTAAGCIENEAKFIELITVASEAKAAAIVYSLQKTYTVPSRVIDCANAAQLPLFRLPWKYRLSDVNSFVAKQVQEAKLQIYRKAQNKLFTLFFDYQPLQAAVDVISDIFGMPVAVADETSRMIASSDDAVASEHASECNRIKIIINGLLSGYLLVFSSPERPDPETDSEFLKKYILNPVSLWFYRQSIEDMTVMKLKNSFVWDLANKNYTSIDEMKQQGRQLHLDLNRPYTCALLQATTDSQPVILHEYSNASAQTIATVNSLLVSAGKDAELRVMFAERGFRFILFIENKRRDPVSLINRFLDDVDKALALQLPQYAFYWGISEVSLDPPDFNRFYNNASLALQYCLSSNTGKHRFTYRDTKEAGIISALSDAGDIRREAHDALDGIIAYDAANRMDLMATLTEYLNSNYNASLAARRLHIHRQSLLYRLEKIETLSGFSLSDHKDLFLLEIYARFFNSF